MEALFTMIVALVAVGFMFAILNRLSGETIEEAKKLAYTPKTEVRAWANTSIRVLSFIFIYIPMVLVYSLPSLTFLWKKG